MSPPLVWLITGTSSGIGRELVLAALERGDHVIATARSASLSNLDDLKALGAKVLELDVTAPLDSLNATAQAAAAFYGRIDVLVNNAGYVHTGTIEESTPQETFNQFNTNVFGAMNVARAVLPFMREKRSGTVVWIGSRFGWHPSAVAIGTYTASKYALRGISESLDLEISPLGLRSICVDFGFFRTPIISDTKRTPYIPRIEDYKSFATHGDGVLRATNSKQPGDPRRGALIIVDVLHGEGSASGKTMPSSLLLGTDCYEAVQEELMKALKNQDEWADVTKSTDILAD
ncbi:NAD(P)-binding protein [Hymenopellis radicata]|nr:NAD(P)-binding protein [Hymenopellis radicata]